MVIMDKKSLEILTIPDSNDMLIDNGSLIAAAIAISPSPHQQKQIIRDLTNNSISKPGNLFFLISNRYKGGPVLPSKMISVGVGQELVVEVYPLCLKLIDARDGSESTIRLSKKASLHELHERVCSLKRTDTRKVRIWDYFNKRKQTLLEDSTKTLEKSDLQMNQSILLEVQVDGILPTGFDMDSTRNEIKICVNVSALARPFFLLGFEPSDTVRIVKIRVNDLIFKTPIQENFLPFHPATREMVSSDGIVFGDDQTLASLYETCCSNGDNFITMYYIRDPDIKGTPEAEEHFYFLRLTKCARFIEEPHEDKDRFMQRVCPEDGDEDGDEAETKTKTQTKTKTETETKTKTKTKTRSPTHAQLQRGQKLFMGRSHCFKFAVSIKTTANVILLAPNPEIFTHLVVLNSKCEYLVLHVCWDMQSYVFLRTVRASYPNIPIVAVTDLDPHHLYLLTFLDTPPDYLLFCYGWDLSEDFDEDYITDNDFVNIEWLGLCPNDFEALHFDDDARPSPLPGFEEVIRMLRVNPYLRRKEDWLAALDWLDLYGKSVSFRLGDDFVSRKLSKKDWV
ncbi:hypothetical protein POM88_054506 [Heracleum sosnowskyi]|uniref:Uncharacterized protein n=1 Tax=Heracleum sosnowskyi TaxID=360622 RepID=A0AAD8LWL5_9APIA|nr:hypothetical protein POM88_054506 [Heracleum sosnowskyi]